MMIIMLDDDDDANDNEHYDTYVKWCARMMFYDDNDEVSWRRLVKYGHARCVNVRDGDKDVGCMPTKMITTTPTIVDMYDAVR